MRVAMAFQTIDSEALVTATGGAQQRHRVQRDPWAGVPGMVKTGPNSYKYVGNGGNAFESRGQNWANAAGIGLWGLGASLGMGLAGIFGR